MNRTRDLIHFRILLFTISSFFCGYGCSDPLAPLPSGAVPFTPPLAYLAWWEEVEQCSGKIGDYSSVSWYEVPDSARFTVGNDHFFIGYWQPGRNSITLAGLRVNDSLVVRHEELHAILNTADHPALY